MKKKFCSPCVRFVTRSSTSSLHGDGWLKRPFPFFCSFPSCWITERRRVATHELSPLSPDLRSHLIGLPGQIGIPANSNDLDHGKPRETQTPVRTNGLWPRSNLDSELQTLDEASIEGESQKKNNQPVVQRNEVEVGDLDRRPQLEDRRGTCDAWDVMDKAQNAIQRTHVVVGDESVAVVLHGERRGRQQDVNNCIFPLQTSLLTLHFSRLSHQETADPPTHPLSERWWWAPTPVGEKSVQKVWRVFVF